MGKCYVMSDIHGDYSAFLNMMKLIEFSDEDILYILGDVVDRGQQNLAMLDACMNHKNICLIKGNHEYYMQSYLKKDKGVRSIWNTLSFGGKNTLKELDQCSELQRNRYAEYLESLPLYKVVNASGKDYILTHSGWLCTEEEYIYKIDGKVDTIKNIAKMAKENEYEYLMSQDICSIPERINFDITAIVGHVPTISAIFDEPQAKIFYGENYIDIDCGNGFKENGGRQSCLELNDFKEFYIS